MVKCSFLYINGSKSGVFRTAAGLRSSWSHPAHRRPVYSPRQPQSRTRRTPASETRWLESTAPRRSGLRSRAERAKCCQDQVKLRECTQHDVEQAGTSSAAAIPATEKRLEKTDEGQPGGVKQRTLQRQREGDSRSDVYEVQVVHPDEDAVEPQPERNRVRDPQLPDPILLRKTACLSHLCI